MREEKIYGAMLVLGALAFLGTGALHPTGTQMLASAESFAQHAPLNVLVHALALGGVWLTFVGLVGFARRLGLQRPDVIAGLVAYALAACMVCVAAITDGLVSTRLAEAHLSADEPQRATLRALMKFCYYLASSLTRYYVTAMAVALLLWSWAAWRTRFDRVLPWIGAAIAAAGLVAQLTGHLRMNVHDVMLLAMGQGLWTIWAGIVIWRLKSPV